MVAERIDTLKPSLLDYDYFEILTNSDDVQDMRKALEGPAKHIRVCTIDDDSFFDEVYPTGILTDKEISVISLSKIKNVKQNDLIEFSNEVECRTNRRLPPKCFDFSSMSGTFKKPLNNIEIITKRNAIELLPFNFIAKDNPFGSFVPAGLKQEYQCKIMITRITDYYKNTSSEPPITVEICKEVEYGERFTVPVTKDGKNITLLPNNKYQVDITFNSDVQMFFGRCENPLTNEHMSVMLPVFCKGLNQVPLKMIYYRPH